MKFLLDYNRKIVIYWGNKSSVGWRSLLEGRIFPGRAEWVNVWQVGGGTPPIPQKGKSWVVPSIFHSNFEMPYSKTCMGDSHFQFHVFIFKLKETITFQLCLFDHFTPNIFLYLVLENKNKHAPFIQNLENCKS